VHDNKLLNENIETTNNLNKETKNVNTIETNNLNTDQKEQESDSNKIKYKITKNILEE